MDFLESNYCILDLADGIKLSTGGKTMPLDPHHNGMQAAIQAEITVEENLVIGA